MRSTIILTNDEIEACQTRLKISDPECAIGRHKFDNAPLAMSTLASCAEGYWHRSVARQPCQNLEKNR